MAKARLNAGAKRRCPEWPDQKLVGTGIDGLCFNVHIAGIGLLLADRLSDEQRKAVGWTLLAIGAISTIPLGIEVFGRSTPVSPSRGRSSVA